MLSFDLFEFRPAIDTGFAKNKLLLENQALSESSRDYDKL